MGNFIRPVRSTSLSSGGLFSRSPSGRLFCSPHLIVLLLILSLAACSEEKEPRSNGSGRSLDYPATVTFVSGDSDTVATLEAAVAEDDATRSTGLMEVYDMPMDKGMLFIFDDEEPRSFWMANTPLALDIIFVSAGMEIVRIQKNTRPYSDSNILSERPAMYVVETNAGYTLRHDIYEGMKILISR